jgi:hypothetical protein
MGQILMNNQETVQVHHAELFVNKQEEQLFTIQMNRMKVVLREWQIRAGSGN